ncbi:hypothetical protein Q4485_07090 [Granulosicoccaceae sp. 1_MG-2023]|nr:hypothetical protein [Granulosicoccaceae sp. 1_MG-2023]
MDLLSRRKLYFLLSGLTTLLLLSGCAGTGKSRVGAEALEAPFSNLPVDFSYQEIISGPGVTRSIRHVYRGLSNALHRWDLYLARGDGNTVWQTRWYNREGALVQIDQNGNQESWSPHDCFLVEGECEFSYTDAYGFTNRYLRIGERKGNRYSYDLQRYEANGLTEFSSGDAVLNADGIVIKHEFYTGSNGYQRSEVTGFY